MYILYKYIMYAFNILTESKNILNNMDYNL